MSEEYIGKRPSIDIGYRIGHLIVETPTDTRKNGYTIWHCRCDCGGEILLDTRKLQRGTQKDCGCISKLPPGARDITGQRFGRLVALEPTKERGNSGSVIWRCRCDCGKEITAPLSQLTKGYRKSCGCWGHPPLQDLAGKRFGFLTVLHYVEKRKGQHIWLCKCDCGKETEVRQNYLQRGHTTSCGCRQAEQIYENLKLVDGTSVTLLEAGKKRLLKSNTSGYTGVYRRSKSGKWQAQITFRKKTYYLGSFEKLEDAVKARKLGEEIHDNFLEWYYTEYKRNEKDGK